jgi:SSS family solute:Na+ symporter
MDSVLFVVTLIGGLVLLPVAMHYAGGLPELWKWLQANPQLVHPKGLPTHTQIVPTDGPFNYVFILAIMLLSIKFATVDQAILQRAFGARDPRVGAKGMVFAGIVTVPIAMFCILPGLAMAKLQPVALNPALANPDLAIPRLLQTYLPMAGPGLLGVVLCGLVASQIDTITSDINSVATLMTSDVYRNLRRREPSERELLFVVRLSSILCGALMLAVAYFLKFTDTGAVNVNLAVVGILDMPLFVITVIYGLFWRRANWQGAVAGFVAGGTVGVMSYVILHPQISGYAQAIVGPVLPSLRDKLAAWNANLGPYQTWLRSIAPISSTLTALAVTPLVSLVTPASRRPQAEQIWTSFQARQGEDDSFSLIPHSAVGRLAAVVALLGFAIFLGGVISAAWRFPHSGALAVGGMITVFAGGITRVYVE